MVNITVKVGLKKLLESRHPIVSKTVGGSVGQKKIILPGCPIAFFLNMFSRFVGRT